MYKILHLQNYFLSFDKTFNETVYNVGVGMEPSVSQDEARVGQEASEGWPIVMFIMCARGHSEPVVGSRKGRVIWIKKQDSSKILHATTGFIIEENVAMRVDSLAKFVTCFK